MKPPEPAVQASSTDAKPSRDAGDASRVPGVNYAIVAEQQSRGDASARGVEQSHRAVGDEPPGSREEASGAGRRPGRAGAPATRMRPDGEGGETSGIASLAKPANPIARQIEILHPCGGQGAEVRCEVMDLVRMIELCEIAIRLLDLG